MSRHDLVQSDPSFAEYDLHAGLDRMLRSGLLKVFPLPIAKDAADERFHQLLDALAAKGQNDSH